MGVVLSIIRVLGPIMWIVALLAMMGAISFVRMFLWFRKYPVRCIIYRKRADGVPLITVDKAGRVKDKDGFEKYKMFFTKDLIDVPDTKYLYKGRSILNPTILNLWEENGRYTPTELHFDSNNISLRPINTGLEYKRLAAERLIKAKHETMSAFEKNKGTIVTAVGVFIVIVIIIVMLTKGDQLKGMAGGMFGLAPLMMIKCSRLKTKLGKSLSGLFG